MMIRRVGRPGLIGTAARTAVIAGTATAVSGGVAKMQGYGPKPTPEPAPAPPPQPQTVYVQAPEPAAPAAQQASGMSMEAMEQLKQLAQLHESGVLTDEEFAAQKEKLLH